MHHPQVCRGDVCRRFCGGSARISWCECNFYIANTITENVHHSHHNKHPIRCRELCPATSDLEFQQDRKFAAHTSLICLSLYCLQACKGKRESFKEKDYSSLPSPRIQRKTRKILRNRKSLRKKQGDDKMRKKAWPFKCSVTLWPRPCEEGFYFKLGLRTALRPERTVCAENTTHNLEKMTQ